MAIRVSFLIWMKKSSSTAAGGTIPSTRTLQWDNLHLIGLRLPMVVHQLKQVLLLDSSDLIVVL